MTSSIIHDPNFPHGAIDGYTLGCSGSHCPAPVKCLDVHIRYAGDLVFHRALDAGMTAAEFVATEQERAQEAAQAAKEARQAQIREAARERHNEARRQRREAKKPTHQLVRDGVIRTELQAHIHALHRRGLTDGEIGLELGKTREQVKAIRGALKLAPNKLPTIDARLKQLHGEGKTDMEIAVELGKHHRYIAARRRDFGLPLNRKAPATTGALSLSNQAGEEWRPIPGFEGRYEVSSTGRVRSLDRTTRTGAKIRGRIKIQYTHPTGYRSVKLSLDGDQFSRWVHRLVLQAFVGPAPDGMESCHRNGDPGDNSLSNLRWGTHLSNMHDIYLHGNHPRLNRTACPRGHQLREPNLRKSSIRRGTRECLACDLERKKALRDGRPFKPAEADLRFSRIMRGAA